MSLYRSLIFSILIFSFFSCNSLSSDAYISNFYDFVASVEKEYQDYQSNDWEKKDLIFEQFSEVDYEKYKSNLTSTQNTEVNRLIGKYQAIKIKSAINSTSLQLNNVLEQAGGLLEELYDNNTKDTN
jgi:hypothetical protein